MSVRRGALGVGSSSNPVGGRLRIPTDQRNTPPGFLSLKEQHSEAIFEEDGARNFSSGDARRGVGGSKSRLGGRFC